MFQTTNQMRKYDEIWENVGGEENPIGLGGMASMMGIFCLRGAVAVGRRIIPFVPKGPCLEKLFEVQQQQCLTALL